MGEIIRIIDYTLRKCRPRSRRRVALWLR